MNPKILGVEVGTESKREIFEFVQNSLRANEQRVVVTLNPEIILKAQKDQEYKDILNSADLKLVDGFGLKLSSWLKKVEIGERMPGANLAEYVLENSLRSGCKVGLIIKKGGLSTKGDVKKHFQNQNNIEVIELDEDRKEFLSETFDVVLVGLGAPWQEKLIWQAKKNGNFSRLAIGVGGTIDFWVRKQKRAPRWMSRIGMEWCWRLISRPNRFFRVWNATIVFLWKALLCSQN